MVMSELEMDINCYPTVASMTDAYYIEQGIYESVNEMAGVPLKFHANASVGGRVMCANNERLFTAEEMDDTDANSLYPSAQIRLGGFLKGKPKVFFRRRTSSGVLLAIDDMRGFLLADGCLALIDYLRPDSNSNS